jgi:hypothetical protein
VSLFLSRVWERIADRIERTLGDDPAESGLATEEGR